MDFPDVPAEEKKRAVDKDVKRRRLAKWQRTEEEKTHDRNGEKEVTHGLRFPRLGRNSSGKVLWRRSLGPRTRPSAHT